MAVPVWSVGQVLASADVNSWFVPAPAYKTSTTSRATNVTPTADPDLQAAVAANAVYRLLGQVLYDADTTGQLQIGWSGPAGFTVNFSASRLKTSAALASDDAMNAQTATATGAGALGAGTAAAAIITGIVRTSATSGTLALTWAQLNSSATATILHADCYIELQRIG